MTTMFVTLGTWNWLILGLLLMGVELLAPGVFMFWLGLAALLVGLLSFVSPAFARWYEQCREMVVERGGDPRRFSDLTPVMLARAESDPPPLVTVEDVVPHLEHVREVAGVAHVGLGGDFDGSAFMPHDLYDVSCYPVLLDALRERGWSAAELEGLRSGNVLRVLREAEEAAA